MSNNGTANKSVTAIPKGATKTDLRLTRHPADTPRGRLHKLAVTSIRAVDELRRSVKLDKNDLVMLRTIALRAYKAVSHSGDVSAGASVIHHLCWGLDRALEVLAADIDVVGLCEGLMLTLVQLEVAENTVHDLQVELEKAKQDTRYALGDVSQLRTLLAKLQVEEARRMAAEHEADGFGPEETRRRELTDDEKMTIDDPDARR